MKGYSIIITAYKTADYIEECLDSVYNQKLWDTVDHEILLGIDHCEQTRQRVLEIKHKYPTLRVFYNPKNVGTYITRNTLCQYAKHDRIAQIDSDDIISPDLFLLAENHIADIIKFYGVNFRQTFPNLIGDPKVFVSPAIYSKKVFDAVGGYKDWICGADTEFAKRTEGFFSKRVINKVLYYRRVHSLALTQQRHTKGGSKIRNQYKKLIPHRYAKLTHIIPVTTEAEEIF
jgi:glycosyltransferase involved in cell wall biosynthesis